MNRKMGGMPQWAHEEAARIELLRGEARLDALWKLAERLKAGNETEGEFEVMRSILRISWKEARLDHTLRAFGETRHLYQNDPKNSHFREPVLWYFKWLVDELPEYADVPAQTIEKILDDMTQFYRHEGESLRPVFGLRCKASLYMGHIESANQWYEKWLVEPAGKSDDCAACEAALQIQYLLETEKKEEALLVAAPIMKGEIYCEDTPETWTRLIGPAMILRGPRAARVLSKISQRRVRKVPSMIAAVAAHAVHSTFLADFPRARRMALHALRRAPDMQNDWNRYSVYRSCGLWAAMTVLIGKYNKPIPARIVPGMAKDASGMVELPDVASRSLDESAKIAARFDARNGNNRCSERLRDLEKAIRDIAERMDSGSRL